MRQPRRAGQIYRQARYESGMRVLEFAQAVVDHDPQVVGLLRETAMVDYGVGFDLDEFILLLELFILIAQAILDALNAPPGAEADLLTPASVP